MQDSVDPFSQLAVVFFFIIREIKRFYISVAYFFALFSRLENFSLFCSSVILAGVFFQDFPFCDCSAARTNENGVD